MFQLSGFYYRGYVSDLRLALPVSGLGHSFGLYGWQGSTKDQGAESVGL